MNAVQKPVDPTSEQLGALDPSPDPVESLVRQFGLSRAHALRVLGQHFGCPWLELSQYRPDPSTLRLLNEQQARRWGVLPLFQIGERLYLALSNPSNLKIQDQIAALTGSLIEPVLAHSSDIEEAVTRHLVTREESSKTIQALSATISVEERRTAEAPNDGSENPIVRIVDHILAQAIRLGASDLHLEPFPQQVRLRYRIDGVLRDYPAPPWAAYQALVTRIKITAGMDIAERRLPQDGRTQLLVDDQKYDLRISVLPNVHGEGIVARILNSHRLPPDLALLGFEKPVLERYQSVLQRPNGILLVTGPTGAGKSTTLYATLMKVRSAYKKAITLEDPVEHQIEGVQQIQVAPDIGYTFAEGLRAILRHDPDIILVGEIRDLESAQIAIRAALTGHQIFSTLHTNSAVQALTRLSDMGIPQYQVLAALNAVLDQRLIRKLCPHCKEPYQGNLPEELGGNGMSAPTFPLYRARGCLHCNEIGFKGRVAVQELLDLTPELKMVASRSPLDTDFLEQASRQGSYFPLHDSLSSKVREGLTSAQEALALLGKGLPLE